MKQYPSIERTVSNVDIIAFDKLDGSNIRAEWSRKSGFYKFGSSHQLIDQQTPIFGESIDLIKAKYDNDLSKIFVDNKHQNVVAFFEFFGPNSFAGNHTDEQHDVVLFDVNVHKTGMLSPRVFLKQYGHLHIPNVCYEGKPNIPFVESVLDSTLTGMTFEGVVCKGVGKNGLPIMFKIKSNAWKEKLKTYCAGDDNKYNILL